MDSNQIVSKMNFYLHIASQKLVELLNDALPRISKNWWKKSVIDKLSNLQREKAIKENYTKLEDFDLSALLRILDKAWYEINSVYYLNPRERECAVDMLRVRNNWAHCSANLPNKESIIEDLNVMNLFFEQRGNDNSVMADISNFIKEINCSSLESLPLPPKIDPKPVITQEQTPSNVKQKIELYKQICLVSDPTKIGVVMAISQIGNVNEYTVFLDGKNQKFFEEQIKLVESNLPKYNWLSINDFRSLLTAYQINNPSKSDLYSLNSARIDFVPYQFRPALKLIHSDEPKILIADSVGVGKTIEAGLIIKELKARTNLEKILIICPKPLVVERKWEMEMKRFDELFIPVDGATLRRCLSDTDKYGIWPETHNKIIIPYSILDGKTFSGKNNKRHYSIGLSDLKPAPHFDLVIIDEAHHIRNGRNRAKSNHYAYQCVKYFCDNSEAVVMLTATPVQNNDDDLFTLLNLIRPDVIIDKTTFTAMSEPNRFISECSKYLRSAEGNWRENALKSLVSVKTTQWGKNVISINPTYNKAIDLLEKQELTREERVKLITMVEELHSFNTMLNRTRRKDIEEKNFCKRRSDTIEVDFTDKQKELHSKLLEFIAEALTQYHGSASGLPFMMSTIKRQAASCIFGLVPQMNDLLSKRFSQLSQELAIDTDEEYEDLNENSLAILKELEKEILGICKNLPEEDPKFESILKIINEKQNQDNNKIMIFSSFKHTLKYLKKKLLEKGYKVDLISGDVKDEDRQELREKFEKNKGDEEALDILLFTEVGSEGLDYQFCNTMINYDLPWNPMRIEQRIGRIDRRGQKSEAVNIHNIITKGTVDATIFNKCLNKIGIFEKSIGECDDILGEITTEINKIAVDPKLTEEEREKMLEQMSDNEVRKIQELDKLESEQKELFGLDLTENNTANDISNSENPWLSPKSLQIMIEKYLFNRLKSNSCIYGNSESKQLRLSKDFRPILLEDYLKLPRKSDYIEGEWKKYLQGLKPNHSISFSYYPNNAENNTDTFLINPMHPLAKQAARYFDEKIISSSNNQDNNSNCVHLVCKSDVLKAGIYYFSVYSWEYTGINSKHYIKIVSNDDILENEFANIIQEADSVEGTGINDFSPWEELKAKHYNLWEKEKASYITDAQNTANFKIESLKNFYNKRIKITEQILEKVEDKSIITMHTGTLEKLENELNHKINQIQKQLSHLDIHQNLLAFGLIEVK